MSGIITMGQLSELIAQAESGRVTRDLLQTFLQDPKQISESMKYPVLVNYDRSVAEMIAAGRYDWYDEDINDNSFHPNGAGIVEVEIELIPMHKRVNSEMALTALDHKGFRPATNEELLAFGETYPLLKVEVIQLGSLILVGPGDRRFVSCLRRDGSFRKLNLFDFSIYWPEKCYFAAVSKAA